MSAGTTAADVFAGYEKAFAGRDAPFAFVDLDALDANAEEMARQAGGVPIRVASKSVRSRAVMTHVLTHHVAFRGILAFTPAEALWLSRNGLRDCLVAYPSTDRAALNDVAAARRDGETDVVLMVDSAATLEPVATAARRHGVDLPVCIDVDAAFRTLGGRVAIGPKRSPVRTAHQARELAELIEKTEGTYVDGLMAYDGQIAGVGDRPVGRPFRGLAIRAVQAASLRELRTRLPEILAAVQAVVSRPLRITNLGGTGSLSRVSTMGMANELSAGSGLYAPTLFDTYRSLSLSPAAMFVLPVVRRPGRAVATALGGGYIASGPAGPDRVPRPVHPVGLSLDPREGAGEVQTPLLGPVADRLTTGDHVYFRHAKAGELAERFATLLLVRGSEVVDEVPTYRGEGRTFL